MHSVLDIKLATESSDSEYIVPDISPYSYTVPLPKERQVAEYCLLPQALLFKTVDNDQTLPKAKTT